MMRRRDFLKGLAAVVGVWMVGVPVVAAEKVTLIPIGTSVVNSVKQHLVETYDATGEYPQEVVLHEDLFNRLLIESGVKNCSSMNWGCRHYARSLTDGSLVPHRWVTCLIRPRRV